MGGRPSWREAGFTILEVLIAVAIIAILSAMLLSAAGAMQRAGKRSKTMLILETVRQSLELRRTETGSFMNPAEHPLAGSRGPRFAFMRDASHVGGGPDQVTVPAVDPTTEPALVGVGLANLAIPAAKQRLLLADDVYADARVPLLFGLRRDSIGLLGASLDTVQRYRRLPKPPIATATIANPDDLTAYPDRTCLIAATSTLMELRDVFQFSLTSGSGFSELVRMKAIDAPDEATGAAIANGRVWSRDGAAPAPAYKNRWQPGLIEDPAASGRWVRYGIRGGAVYDAWGREILYSLSATGQVRLVSAGYDGVFRWDSGSDGILQTDARASSPTGDDRDGSRDNVQMIANGGIR